MTLQEFLLARFAEDEAWAQEELFPYHWRIGEARIAADCEAKRRILTRCSHVLAAGAREDAHAVALGVLEDLALAYAAHPDYRTQWGEGQHPPAPSPAE